MKIFPAIDLRGGNAVRLYQGDYDQETVYSEDPRKVAEGFRAAGARYLHIVDLDGARDGELVNTDVIRSIIEDLDMFVEVGGGIRDEERIRQYLDMGVSRVILGTIAQKDPAFAAAMAQKYGEKIAVGVDARDGKVAVNGWKEITDKDSCELCEEMAAAGVKAIIYTDISKDGGLTGTNMAAYERLSKIEGLKITASGGISSEEELEQLAGMVDAAILGKAIYAGRLDLARCVAIGGPQE
jgi:phosphoribosylformimino-5-aminoimidazole carboxamide ribotide isomerase